MEITQGYARRPKRIYAVEKCGFFHFVITLDYPFCTNFLQTFLMKKFTVSHKYKKSKPFKKFTVSKIFAWQKLAWQNGVVDFICNKQRTKLTNKIFRNLFRWLGIRTSRRNLMLAIQLKSSFYCESNVTF